MIDGRRPVLLLLARERTVFALNPAALAVAQNSGKTLSKDYVDECILTQEGDLYTIRKINVGNFYGQTFGRKVWSVLTGLRSISVELEKLPRPSLETLKATIGRFIQYDAESPEPMLPQKDSIDRVLQRIGNARSVSDLFAAFDIPGLEDCLDVL